MSAFLVDKRHVDVLVALALHGPRGGTVSPDTVWHEPRWAENDPRDCASWQDVTWRRASHMSTTDLLSRADLCAADELGDLLWAENAASLRYRYSDSDDMFPTEYAHGYAYERPSYIPTAVEGLHAIACLEYQSCEHPEWQDSEACRFLASLQGSLIAALDGYRDAPWEWDDAKLEDARRRAAMPPAKRDELERREQADRNAEQAAYLRLFTE